MLLLHVCKGYRHPPLWKASHSLPPSYPFLVGWQRPKYSERGFRGTGLHWVSCQQIFIRVERMVGPVHVVGVVNGTWVLVLPRPDVGFGHELWDHVQHVLGIRGRRHGWYPKLTTQKAENETLQTGELFTSHCCAEVNKMFVMTCCSLRAWRQRCMTSRVA